MGKLTSLITFTGSVGGLTAYRFKGSDTTFIRTKAGPSRDRLKNGPEFVNSRRSGTEFGGRSTMAAYIRILMEQLKSPSRRVIVNNLSSLLVLFRKKIR